MSSQDAILDTPNPLPFRRRARLFGLGLCSLLVLAACAPQERSFNSAGGGGEGGSGHGSSTTTTGSGGGPQGSGGGVACDASDPDCECIDEVLVARDTDQDGQGTRLCEAAPGGDCDDGDVNFVQNQCGGCNKDLGGKVGDPCGGCGNYQCQGDSALQCATPSPAIRQCSGGKIQVCSSAQWVDETTCSGSTPACVNAKCVACYPGTFKCGTVQGTPVSIRCLDTGSWESSWTSCDSLQTCSSSTGMCVGMIFHPRDRDFDVPALLRLAPGAPGAPDTPSAPPGMRTEDVLDLAVGIAFT